jgi:hypothetical protein
MDTRHVNLAVGLWVAKHEYFYIGNFHISSLSWGEEVRIFIDMPSIKRLGGAGCGE